MGSVFWLLMPFRFALEYKIYRNFLVTHLQEMQTLQQTHFIVVFPITLRERQ